METVAIIAGLVGALATAGLSYLVRSHLDRQALKDAERRLAYVHLVLVSWWVASELVIRVVIEKAIAPLLPEKAKGTPDTYGMSHALCVAIEKLIKERGSTTLHEPRDFTPLLAALRSSLEYLKDSRLTPEQLARLPKDCALSYSQFVSGVVTLSFVVDTWRDTLESGRFEWITADTLHGQWLSLVTAFEAARKVRLALIRFGAVEDREAMALLSAQADIVREQVNVHFKQYSKLELARAAIEEKVDGADA